MDAALQLRIAYDDGASLQNQEIEKMLGSSPLVQKLTGTFEAKPLFVIWRIIALSEIPGSSALAYTQKCIEHVEKYLSSPSGFTLTGKAEDLLPCYNSMLIEAFCKLGLASTDSVKKALDWVEKYQPFVRGETSCWQGTGTKKYGGCLKTVPCFLGIAKTAKALCCYNQATHQAEARVGVLLQKAMDYILQHQLYQRLSNDQPINQHIVDLAFPASYQLNIVELLELAYKTGTIGHPACQSAIDFVNGKKNKEGYWKINYVYKAPGFVSFDKRGEKAEWLTYLLNRFMA